MAVFLRLLLLATLISGGPPLRQEKFPPQEALQYEVTVSLKLVQVYVTDKNGQPVADLNKEDFIVLDEGKPVAVTDFERHLIALPGAAPERQPPPPKLAATALPAGRLLNRRFFLFFDFAYNNPRGLNKAREAALHFIDTQLLPEDELSLLSYSALKGLVVHEYLTTDHAKIREDVEAIGTKNLTGRAEDLEEEYWRQAGQGGTMDYKTIPSGVTSTLNPATESRRAESKNQAEHYIERMTSLAKSLRYVAGQKLIVFFSSGIPNSMIYGHQVGKTSDNVGESKFDPGDRVLRSLNEAMYKEFSASNCTLYSFDTREAAKVPSLFDYDEQTLLEGRREGYRDIFDANGVFSDSTERFRNEKLTGADSLKRFADVTGGKYYSNINEYQRNEGEVQNLTGTYYVLGYYVSERPDGRFHDVKVEVKRKGCRVRAQAGYYSPKPFRECSDLEKRLQLFDLALNGRSPFGAPVTMAATALSFPAAGGTRLELLSRIPVDAMARFSAKNLEFVAVILDAKDDVAGFQRTEASITERGESDVVITSGAELKPGRYKCRVIMRDLETGTTGLASVSVEVPESPPAGLTLSSPLLLARDVAPVYVSTSPAAQKDAPSWKDIYVFDQARFAPIVGGVRAGAAKIYAVIPYSFPGPGEAEPGWTARLMRAGSGERVPVSVSPLTSLNSGGLRVQFLELSTDGLPPGEYEIYFRAEDPASGASAEVHAPLKIIT
jgi:VWFA-related protein